MGDVSCLVLGCSLSLALLDFWAVGDPPTSGPCHTERLPNWAMLHQQKSLRSRHRALNQNRRERNAQFGS